jgi:uncharacterized protein HemY
VSRLEQLLRYLNEDPNDPFNIYAVAMEYMSSDQGRSLELLERLIKEHEDYVPAYYHLGKLRYESGDLSGARSVLSAGLSKAAAAGDLKAVKELKNLLTEIEFD